MFKNCPFIITTLLCCSIAQAQGSPQGAAATALGIFTGLGLGSEALTRSKLEVKVEMFQDTDVKPPDLTSSKPGNSKNIHAKALAPGEEERTRPFKLGAPSALYQLAKKANDPTLTPTLAQLHAVRTQLQPIMARFEKVNGSLDETIDFLSRYDLTNRGAPETREYLKSLRSNRENMIQAWVAFTEAMEDAESDGEVSESEVGALAENLAACRIQLEKSEPAVPPLYFELLGAQIVLALPPPSEPGGVLPEIGHVIELGYQLAQEPQHDPETSIAKILWSTRASLLAISANEKRELVESDLTALDALLAGLGILLPGEQLLALESEGDVLNALTRSDKSLFAALSASRTEAYLATFSSITSSANFGPIVNEVMQQILAKNAMLDSITDKRFEKRWVVVNRAKSVGRTGTHNTVIYLENNATPIVKSAAFDPSEFIKANAVLYETAFNSAAAVFGIPLAGEPATPLNSANLFAFKKKQREIEREKANTRREIVKTLTGIMHAQNAKPSN